jgi:2-desacetyl-2-hydroxyethyl bacteriochlorophyllide A dehydrogenase
VNRTTLYFTAPRVVECRNERLPELGPDEILVKSEVSAISAGSEMLVYRGEFGHDVEEPGDALSSRLHFPMPYGYCAVGRVVEAGTLVAREWLDRLVFAFQAHSSLFAASPQSVYPVPEGLAAEDAVLLPNMETAVNLVQDAAPILGERALVLGQGTVGLLTVALLQEFPLDCLVTADRYEERRKASLGAGATDTLDPSPESFREQAISRTGTPPMGYDLTLELSGNPEALDDAISLTAFSGRVVVGSWYGRKKATVDLGGRFHRSRIRIISSQVSTISPELSARWNKSRRFAVAWDALSRIGPSRWITQRFPIEKAAEAYRILDEFPEKAIQVVLTYA